MTAIAIRAEDAVPRPKPSNLPEVFDPIMSHRIKQPLGDAFGLQNFGVNRTTIPPGAHSALLHRHSAQDEFIYILEGTATLVTETGEMELTPGMCAGFAAGGHAHCLINRTDKVVVYLEVGDRTRPDMVDYPEDDLIATSLPDGSRTYHHKDGALYPPRE